MASQKKYWDVLRENMSAQAMSSGALRSSLRRHSFRSAEQNAFWASNARSIRSASASASVLVGQALRAGGHANSELVTIQRSCNLFLLAPADGAPGETAQEAQGGDGTHTAARLFESSEFGGGEGLRSAFWQVRGRHTASNFVERIKCSR